MKHSRFSEEQVAYALRQAEAGTPVGNVCRQMAVSKATLPCVEESMRMLRVAGVRLPHSSLGHLRPNEFVTQHQDRQTVEKVVSPS